MAETGHWSPVGGLISLTVHRDCDGCLLLPVSKGCRKGAILHVTGHPQGCHFPEGDGKVQQTLKRSHVHHREVPLLPASGVYLARRSSVVLVQLQRPDGTDSQVTALLGEATEGGASAPAA